MRPLRSLLGLSALAVTAAALPAAGAADPLTVPCSSETREARSLDITVEGQPAHGLYAAPRGPAKGLVAFFHGYGHTSESWRHHMVRVAQTHDVITLAMDYRGTVITPPARAGELPSSRGWQVAEGAADTVAAAQAVLARCAVDGPVVAYGVSMGGNASGLAVAARPQRPVGAPLWDYWVDVEGAANVLETYHEASAVALSGNAYAVNAKADIEREMGGTPDTQRDRYLERTVVTRAADIAAAVKGVVTVHGADDGLVPVNQTLELGAALRRAGVPVDSTTVLTREASSEPGTTLTGTVAGAAGVPGYTSPFAGHASEASTTHTVGNEGFRALALLLRGEVPACRDTVLDGMSGQRQQGPGGC